MALVRCTCVTRLDAGSRRLEVVLADPDCGYVVHRLVDDAPAVSE